MNPLLPPALTWSEYETLFKDSSFGLEAARAVLAREGLPAAPERVVAGTNLIFRAGDDRWLKIYAPLEAGARATESAMLDAVAGRLGVATPEIVSRGEIDGWDYLLLTHIDGVPFDKARASMSDRDRVAIAEELGAALRNLHGIDVAGIAPASDWASFLEERITGAPTRARAHGADERWEGLVAGWIDRHAPELRSMNTLVPLHADLHFDHLLVVERAGSWRVAGVIDFADARYGAAEYELVNPILWLFRGERDAIAAMLSAYGDPPLDRERAGRLIAWTLVHEFFRFGYWFRDELADASVRSIDDVVARVLPVMAQS